MNINDFREKYDCDNCKLIGLALPFKDGKEYFACNYHNLNSDKGEKQRKFYGKKN